MKKNVFSRTIAVLASMTVLGAASMLSASAKSVDGGTVTVKEGETVANVPLVVSSDISSSQGCMVRLTGDASAFKSVVAPKELYSDGDIGGDGFVVVYTAAKGVAGGSSFDTLQVTLADNLAPGEYVINIESLSLDADGTDVGTGDDGDGSASAGTATIVVEAEETEPAPTTTEAPTTAAATTTTAAPKASPKTGSAGVAVAVAGLVTAGATAVVLKKKH